MNLEILKQYEQNGLTYSQVHPTLPLTIYNYTDKVQWENLWDKVTIQTRGLVVDDKGNIVARPFKKFFNLSEGKTNITNDYVIYEKLDGSLGILFCYNNEWVLASRGSFTSEQAVRGKEILDRECDYELLDKENTYCFEIIYPENKICVEYNGLEACILTGVFNTATGEEQSLDGWGMSPVESYNFKTSLNELHTVIKDNQEGYVVRFSNGERCKIKGVEYLRLHKMMSEMSTTAVWDCLRNGDSILDLLKDFPDEFYNAVREYESYLKNLFEFGKSTVKLEYLKYRNIDDKKEFALAVKDNEYKSFLFSLKNGKDITQQVWKAIKPVYKRL